MTETTHNDKPQGGDFGPDHPMTGVPIISSDSRSQAIEDGVLIDVTDTAKAKHFRYPVALTSAVWTGIVAAGVAPEKEGESGEVYVARIGHILDGLRGAIRDGTDQVSFLITLPPLDTVPVWARCHGGDDGEPVITIMMQGED